MVDSEPFLQFTGSNLLEADPQHAVAEQRPAPELDNHAGVRHAGALFAVGFAASRALVAAAVDEGAEDSSLEMVDSEVAYEKMVSGDSVRATAERVGPDWDPLLARLAAGEAVQLATAVSVRDESGRAVTEMSVIWEAAPKGGGA